MTTGDARLSMLRRLRDSAASDPRIVGLLDYGSSSEGREDTWSDVDVEVIVRDADFDEFERDWKRWAAQFGTLLLAYVGGVGHPWTVYDAAPVPLRVDFSLYRESRMDDMLSWPNKPVDAASMVLYDATGGRLTANAEKLAAQSLAPADLATTYAQVCGDFWYYVVRTYCKLGRGEHWAARYEFNYIVTGLLQGLLRIEAGAVDRWRAEIGARYIERDLPSERIARLDATIPGPTLQDLSVALAKAVDLGREVCTAVALREGYAWPEELAARMAGLSQKAARGEP